MKNLFHYWDDFTRRLIKKEIVLFLDYDGTLAPIARTPVEAELPQENKTLLEQLAEFPHCHVVIISGRALQDVKAMVEVKGIAYIGNHGWEVDGPSELSYSFASPQDKLAMEVVRDHLDKSLRGIEGVLVEDKKVTLSVHYRMVSPHQVPYVKKIFEETCQPYCRQNQIMVSTGKKVLEVRPWIQWDKAKATQWFLDKQPLTNGDKDYMSIYVGDDAADEEVFKAFREDYLTVVVGPYESSYAEFSLKDQAEVTNFLSSMVLWLNTK